MSSREERMGVGNACEFSSRMIENVCQEKENEGDKEKRAVCSTQMSGRETAVFQEHMI